MESMVVFYPCLNIQETLEFYINVIGLKLHIDQGTCKILDSGYGYLGFCEYEDHVLATRTCISFNLKSNEEVDVYYEKLKDKVSYTKPMRHSIYSVYSFFLVDPNGYAVEFQKIQS